MRQGMLLFIGIFTLVQALWCFYVGRRLLSPDVPAPLRTWLWAALILLFLFQWLIPVDMWMDRATPDYSPLRTLLYWASYLSMGFLTLLLFLVFFRDLAGWFLAGSGWLTRDGFPSLSSSILSIGNSLFTTRSSLFLALAAALLNLAGLVQALLPPRVERVEVRIAGLPAMFDGYRIVQFSDLHLGPTHRRACAARAVRIINTLDADLVAFTGDMADGVPGKLLRDSEPLRDIRARDGRLFVTGNHEYYWDAKGWIRRMEELGYRVLMNEHIQVRRGKDTLAVGGIPDFTARRIPLTPAPDIAKAFEGVAEGVPRVLLAHQPAEARNAAPLGVALVLSGHTHAGQFIPFNLLTKLAQPLLGGLYRVGDTQVYVNRGTAWWGPPNRLGIPAEITLVVLRRN
jgi:hypothetical protein